MIGTVALTQIHSDDEDSNTCPDDEDCGSDDWLVTLTSIEMHDPRSLLGIEQ